MYPAATSFSFGNFVKDAHCINCLEEKKLECHATAENKIQNSIQREEEVKHTESGAIKYLYGFNMDIFKKNTIHVEEFIFSIIRNNNTEFHSNLDFAKSL